MSLYVDLVMVFNFVVNFLLLTGTDLVSNHSPYWGRLVVAAAIGSVYSGICLISGFQFLGNGFWRMVFLVIMSVTAFGFCRNALRQGVIFIMLSLALGGLAVCMNGSGGISLLLAAGGLFLMCILVLRNGNNQPINVPVEITYDGQSSRFTALRDTGNTLRDPTTGQRVLVVDCKIAEMIFGFTQQQLRSPVETMLTSGYSRLRLIPYSAVGQPEGMLLGIRCDMVRIGRWKGSVTVAMSPNSIGKGESYQALTGGIY